MYVSSFTFLLLYQKVYREAPSNTTNPPATPRTMNKVLTPLLVVGGEAAGMRGNRSARCTHEKKDISQNVASMSITVYWNFKSRINCAKAFSCFFTNATWTLYWHHHVHHIAFQSYMPVGLMEEWVQGERRGIGGEMRGLQLQSTREVWVQCQKGRQMFTYAHIQSKGKTKVDYRSFRMQWSFCTTILCQERDLFVSK